MPVPRKLRVVSKWRTRRPSPALGVLVAASVVILALGCGEMPGEIGGGPAVAPSPADEGATLAPFITDGMIDPGHPSVGILRSGSALCSATLVGKRTVLTAGHCILSSNLTFEVGGQRYGSARVTRHPAYAGGNRSDLAVVTLAQEVVGVAPSPIAVSPPSVGQQVTLVGFGRTGEWSGGVGTKRMGINTISRVTSTTFSFLGKSNVCNGDSGGFGFVDVGGQAVVAGVHSTKSGFCGHGGTDMRVDAFRQWITTTAGGDVVLPGGGSNPPPPPADCHSGAAFNWYYCSKSCPCDAGQGDCDSNAECKAGLVCKTDVGAKYGVHPTVDVCEQPASDCHQGAAFNWYYCSKSCPCDAGQGDCDSDAECKAGLVCKIDVGAKYGVHPTVDVCEQAATTPPPPPPPPETATEGQSCAQQSCAQGLACTTVFTAGYTQVVGKFCMQRCQRPGADSICNGGESCVMSKTAGLVCFNPYAPQNGYTSPGSGSTPPPPGTQPPTPPGGSGACGFNGAEADVFALLNQRRAEHGVAALKCDPVATQVARAHSQDMCDRHFFSHVNPSGEQPWDRMRAAGLAFSGAGENIALGQPTPEAVTTAWMNSPGHRSNMLNPGWTHAGIGYVACNGAAPYWTEVFFR